MIRKSLFRGALMAAALVASLEFITGCGAERQSTIPETPQGERPTAGPRRGSTPPGRPATLGSTSPGLTGDELSTLGRIQESALTELRQRNPAVVGTATALHDGQPTLLVLTSEPVTRLPRTLQGAAVMELVVGHIRAQTYYCGTSTGRSDECAAGTIGAIVTDGVRNYWLSNWHVFADRQGRAGDTICSPGRYDAGCRTTPVVGTLSRFAPIRFDGSANTVDCAIARIIPGTSVSPIESAGGRSFLPSGHIVAPSVGMAVKKVGRTTGFTTGSIVGVNATVFVDYGFGTAKFTGVVLTSSMSAAGDSGSLICQASTNYPVALLFAGSPSVTVGCPIGAVFSALGAHIAN